MKVKELIEHLKKINPEAEVEFEMSVFTYDCGMFTESRTDIEGIDACGLDPDTTNHITIIM